MAMTAALGRMEEFRAPREQHGAHRRHRRRARRAAVPDRRLLRRAGRRSRSAGDPGRPRRARRGSLTVETVGVRGARQHGQRLGREPRRQRSRRRRPRRPGARASRRRARPPYRPWPTSRDAPRWSCSAFPMVRRRSTSPVRSSGCRPPHHARGRHLDRRRRGRAGRRRVARRTGGVAYVDAPVSGGVAGARARTLAVMYAADDDACAHVEPVLAGLSDRRHRVGDRPGMAQAMKLANNFLSATTLAATSEAVAFGIVGRPRHGHHARSAERRERPERGNERQVPQARAHRSLRRRASPTR